MGLQHEGLQEGHCIELLPALLFLILFLVVVVVVVVVAAKMFCCCCCCSFQMCFLCFKYYYPSLWTIRLLN
jgi:hypothetical protein